MSELTKAQFSLLRRLWVAPARLYGPDWLAFYKLRARGFADYSDGVAGRDFTHGVITETGTKFLSETPSND